MAWAGRAEGGLLQVTGLELGDEAEPGSLSPAHTPPHPPSIHTHTQTHTPPHTLAGSNPRHSSLPSGHAFSKNQ